MKYIQVKEIIVGTIGPHRRFRLWQSLNRGSEVQTSTSKKQDILTFREKNCEKKES